MSVISGKKIAEKIRKRIRREINSFPDSIRKPQLEVIVAGDDEASIYYAGLLKRSGEKENINVRLHELRKTSTGELLTLIESLNNDTEADAILLQLPLPDGICKEKITGCISSAKDVDGQTPENLGRLLSSKGGIYPATARAVLKIIRENGVSITGKRAVVIGRSTTVGLPASLLLIKENATVTICHSKSQPLKDYTLDADILVASAGKPRLIKREHVKEGAYVIDVGTNEVDGVMVGDVDFENVIKKASVSPVKGGVGAITLACLLENTLELYKKNI